MSKLTDLIGTSFNYFLIGIGGIRLKNSSGKLVVRNFGDTADTEITGSKLNASGDEIVLNSDAAGTGADRTLTLARPATGMTAAYTYTFPTTPGTAGQVQATDGAGNTYWITSSNTESRLTIDVTALAFGSTSPVSMFTLPVNAVIEEIRVFVDTIFDGTPSMSVGIAGTTSKYMAATQVDLKDAAGAKIYEVSPGLAPVGTTEALIISYSAGGATVGAARVEVHYVVPV